MVTSSIIFEMVKTSTSFSQQKGSKALFVWQHIHVDAAV